MSWIEDKKKRHEPELSETLSLSPEQIVASTQKTQQNRLDAISYDLQKRLKNELSGIIGEIVHFIRIDSYIKQLSLFMINVIDQFILF